MTNLDRSLRIWRLRNRKWAYYLTSGVIAWNTNECCRRKSSRTGAAASVVIYGNPQRQPKRKKCIRLSVQNPLLNSERTANGHPTSNSAAHSVRPVDGQDY